jgi:uncharacterized protein YwgA
MISRLEQVTAVIAAHPNHELVSSVRLQKTIKLLQRVGLKTDYCFSLLFYGPYSEELHSDTHLLNAVGFVSGRVAAAPDGTAYRVFVADPNRGAADVSDVSTQIEAISRQPSIIIELAALYDAYRELGAKHQPALIKLRRRKGLQCTREAETAALSLLDVIGLTWT